MHTLVDTNEQAKLHLMEKLHRNLSATLNTTGEFAGHYCFSCLLCIIIWMTVTLYNMP